MRRDLSPVGGEQVIIDLGERSYCIDIAAGLLDRADAFSGLPSASVAMIVTNDTVAPLYLERLRSSLAPHYPRRRSRLSRTAHTRQRRA